MVLCPADLAQRSTLSGLLQDSWTNSTTTPMLSVLEIWAGCGSTNCKTVLGVNSQNAGAQECGVKKVGTFANDTPAFSRGMIDRIALLRELNATRRRPAQGFDILNLCYSYGFEGSLLVVMPCTLLGRLLSICAAGDIARTKCLQKSTRNLCRVYRQTAKTQPYASLRALRRFSMGL